MEILKNGELNFWDREYEILDKCDSVVVDNYNLDLKAYKDDELVGDFGISGRRKWMVWDYCNRNNKSYCER